MKREWTLEVVCTEPGCTEKHRYKYDTKRDLQNSFELRNKATYRCVRHAKYHKVVTPENPKVVWESKPVHEDDGRRYCGNSGILHGPGFWAEMKDFPVGTRFVVTVEALPNSAEGDRNG